MVRRMTARVSALNSDGNLVIAEPLVRLAKCEPALFADRYHHRFPIPRQEASVLELLLIALISDPELFSVEAEVGTTYGVLLEAPSR